MCPWDRVWNLHVSGHLWEKLVNAAGTEWVAEMPEEDSLITSTCVWPATPTLNHIEDSLVCVSPKRAHSLFREGDSIATKSFWLSSFNSGWTSEKKCGYASDAALWILMDGNVSAFAWRQSFDCKIISYNWTYFIVVWCHFHWLMLNWRVPAQPIDYCWVAAISNFEKIRKYNR